MRGRDLAAGQPGDQHVHALGHLGLEDGVVSRLDEEHGLVDCLLVEERLVFFPVCTALAVPVYCIVSSALFEKGEAKWRLDLRVG